MSSTNVHSENLTCAGAQIIPTEKSVEIPPKTAKMGPTRMNVILSDYIEIDDYFLDNVIPYKVGDIK